jgi:hypothetical protein
MSLIPYLRFSIATAASPNDATARLAAAVAKSPLLGWADTARPFEGWVRGDKFKISRIATSRRHGFLPLIRGRVIATPRGSRLEGRMRLRYDESIFLPVWSAGMLFGGVAALRAVVRGTAPWAIAVIAVGLLAMPVYFCTLVLRVFASEAREASDFLHQILEGRDPSLLLDESLRSTKWAADPHGAHGITGPVSQLSASVAQGARIGEETLYSSFTPWWKFLFPMLFIAFNAWSTYDFVARPSLWKGGRTWGDGFGLLLFWAFTVLLVRQNVRYRRVKITESGLLVSNYFHEIHVPFTNVASVTYDPSSGYRIPATVKIFFREATPLGHEAEFFPRGRRDRAIAEGIVAEIGMRAGLALQKTTLPTR